MLDINFIRQNPEKVKEACRKKQLDPKLVDKLLSADQKRRKLIKEVEELREQRNLAAKKKNVKKGRQLKIKLKKIEPKLRKIKKEYRELLFWVPNIPADDSPVGKDGKDNVKVYRWGEPPKFDFPIKDHIEIGKELDLIDTEIGTKVGGYRGYYLKNEAVLIQLGLMWLGIQKMIKNGFKLFIPPTIIKEFALIGGGFFPFGKEDIYQIGNPGKLASGETIGYKLFLAGTAEPSLLAYQSDKIFSEDELPLKMCGFSPCYRSEVGSYGKDTHGIYRLHEFMKVEQVVLCKNDVKESDKWLEKMLAMSKEIVEELELPYQVVDVCTGEMGAGKRKMYDIETWMPSRGGYWETHSASNLTDWQSRRLNIKYRGKEGKINYVHALNNTVIASPRILISILECNQQKDGSVLVPKVLQKYTGFKRILTKDK